MKSHTKTNSKNPLYLIINKINGFFDESNGNKRVTLVPADESKNTLKKYEELRSKIRYLVRSITNNSDNYDEKYMKINKMISHCEFIIYHYLYLI